MNSETCYYVPKIKTKNRNPLQSNGIITVMITLKVSDGPCCRHPLLIVQESICHFEKLLVHCLHICEHDSVVKVVAIVPLQVASLTKNVSNGRLLHEGEGRENCMRKTMEEKG